VLTTARIPDGLGRLTSVTNTVTGSAGVVSSHAYHYDAHGRRDKATLADGSHWDYAYDGLGQMTSASRKWSDQVGSEVAGQQFGYSFDFIGNPTFTTTNGRSANYTPNKLNQYNQRDVPGAVDVFGTADPQASVMVNNQAASRHGSYFYKELNSANTPTLNNTQSAVDQMVDVLAMRQGAGTTADPDTVSEQTGRVFVPRTPEVFAYDDDGDLISDGRWT
jgi:YD repeat-containing protein